MDAWTDEGRLYVVDERVDRGATAIYNENQAQERNELNARMVLIDATTLLLERGRREAATVLFACELELEVGESLSYTDAPVWAKIKAPAQLLPQLQDFEHDVAWYVREALAEALPSGYAISEIYFQAMSSNPSGGDNRIAAA
jgi:hypothetical protein